MLAAKGLSANSIRLVLAPLKALYADALDDGLVRTNPAVGVRVARGVAEDSDAEHVRALSEEELRRLIGEVPDEWRLLVELLAQTGLRISEALGLQWRHVDFGRRRLLVRRRCREGRYAPPKSRYGRRDVPLADGLLRRLWEARKAALDASDDGLVFVSRVGGPVDVHNAYRRWFKPACRRAGVDWVGFHALRHTCATLLFRHGMNAKQVQVWLGHHSPAFTLATYVHLVSDDLPGDVGFLDLVTSPTAAVAAEAVEVAR